MSGWKATNLAMVVASANTGLDAIRRAPIVEDDTGIKCLRIQDISQSKPIGRWGNSRVTEKDFERAKLTTGDLIMARTCSPGIVYHVKSDLSAVFNNGLARIRPDTDKTSSSFLYYLFKSPDFIGHIYGISGGTSVQLNMKIGDLLSYEFNLPALPEQKAIAAVLSSLDDKIDLLHRQNKTLEAMAETLFRQWFVEEVGENWEEISVTDIFEVRDGTHDSPKQAAIGKHLITSKHILDGQIDFGSSYLISDDDFIKINQRSKVDSGDILFSMIGTIGLIYFEQSEVIEYAIKNIGLFKTSQNPDWAIYTYLWLKSPEGRQFVDEHRSGSTQEYVALGSLRSIVFKKPPIETLQEFNGLVSGYFSKRLLNQNQIRILETLRDTLLPKLMSGEVRVGDVEKMESAAI